MTGASSQLDSSELPSRAGAPLRPTRSEPGLDLYRGWAVLLMYFAHAWRIQIAEPRGPVQTLVDWLKPSDLYCASSFLFVSGFSLVLAHRNKVARRNEAARSSSAAWLRGVARRALWLYFLAVVLFIGEYGVQVPDLVISPGILSIIACATLIIAPSLVSPKRVVLLALAGAVIFTATMVLELNRWTLPALNTGPGGLLPILFFAVAGAVVAHYYAEHGRRALKSAAWLSLIPFVASLAMGRAWRTTSTSRYALGKAATAIESWLAGDTTAMLVGFWNHTTASALGLLFPLVGTCALFILLQERITRSKLVWPLMVLGRHALFAYVAHLGLLGVITMVGLAPRSAIGTWVVIAVLVVATCVGALVWRRVVGMVRARRSAAR